MQDLFDNVKTELKTQNYSSKTTKSYLYTLKGCFAFKKINLKKQAVENIKSLLLKTQNQGASLQTINPYLNLNTIKFFYREIAKSPKEINLKFAKRNKKPSVVLSRREVKKILKNIKNPKHKLLIALFYGAGLRVSEAIHFESERGGRLSARVPQKIFQKTLKAAGIKKDTTFHSLRHSFTAHLLENGVDLAMFSNYWTIKVLRPPESIPRLPITN